MSRSRSAASAQTLRAIPASRASEETDAELLRAVADGNLGSLGALFDRHHEAVRQFLLRAAPHADDVDDLAQEAFLTAARAASSFDGRASARPFLVGIAAQLLRRRRRTFSRIRALYDAFGSVSEPPPPNPEMAAELAQESARLREAIARLSEDRRIVLVMVEYSGLSGPEVARALDTPVGTVWRRLHEARAELREALTRRDRTGTRTPR